MKNIKDGADFDGIPRSEVGVVASLPETELAKIEFHGPSRISDGITWCVLAGATFYQWDGAGCLHRFAGEHGYRHMDSSRVPKFTTSVDDAITFAWKKHVEIDGRGGLPELLSSAVTSLAAEDCDTSSAISLRHKLAFTLCKVVLQSL